MSELLKIEDINFINLQYGDTEEEINDLKINTKSKLIQPMSLINLMTLIVY